MAIQLGTVVGRKQYFNWRRSFMNDGWITDNDGVVHIPLRNGKEALIDKADEPLAKRFMWRLRAHKGCKGKMYAEAKRLEDELVCAGQKSVISLHRLLLGFPAGLHVDHANGNGLDCRRSNIRIATASQNASNRVYANRHGYRGVIRLKNCRSKPYSAQCQHDGKNHGLGTYRTAELAALAYNFYAYQVFGQFSILNEVTPCQAMN
ncbi:MAG TPA: HNH endonuclease [Nitrospira sp.]|nr:HNH endonuclease [Nitrospira sp.]